VASALTEKKVSVSELWRRLCEYASIIDAIEEDKPLPAAAARVGISRSASGSVPSVFGYLMKLYGPSVAIASGAGSASASAEASDEKSKSEKDPDG